MTWKNGRQLATLNNSDHSVSYSYDSNSVRLSKTVDGEKYTYEYLNGLLMYETRGDAKFWYSYDANGQLYSVKYTLTDSSDLMTYYYTHNSRGDIIGIYNGSGQLRAHYEYDAWGNILSITDQNGNTITSATHVGNLNPFRYRGYYYDSETGFYYLMSRYYDPVTHRFINADGYFQSGGDILDANTFAYCGNNPVNRIDPTGMFWKEIGDFFSKVWSGIKTWANNTFGAGSSTTATIAKTEIPVIPDPSPITVKTGTKTTQTISKHGDSSKPISVYANKDAQHPIKSSSAGININIADFTLDLSVGLDNIGVSGSLANGNTTNSFGVKLNLSEFKVGFEGSTAIQWDNTTETAYTNVSVSGWAIVSAYILVTTGQYVQSPSCAY